MKQEPARATPTDPYAWLRDRGSERVTTHLLSENARTEKAMAGTARLQSALYDEMVARIKETDSSAPVPYGGFSYYTRTEKGKQYSIHCRRAALPSAAEEILLDGNALAAGKAYFRLGAFKVDPSHRLLAYSADFDGSESYLLRVKDLTTGNNLSDSIPATAGAAEWSNDGKTLFYTVLNESRRPHKLFRHRLGSDAASDELVFHEPDEAFFLSIRKTRDKKFFVIDLHSQVTSEEHIFPADDIQAPPRLVEKRRHGVEYSLEHHGERFYVIANDTGRNFRLAATPEKDPAAVNWKDVVPHRLHVLLEGVTLFRSHLVLYERENGLPHARVMALENAGDHRIEFDEAAYSISPGWNPEFDTAIFRFSYSSLVTPSSVYEYDMDSRARRLAKRQEVAGYDPSRYRTERIFACSHDGVQVPVSVVYRDDLRKDGSSPLLLYGYGAYGIGTNPEFSSNRLSLLDRGFAFAIAHVRGGDDLGRGWYEDGKLLKKKNSFLDFVACAEKLIELRYTSPDRLAIYGGSAGGLLMGAVTNLRPDLFRAVIAKVPFVDVWNTMNDKTLPLTVIEHDEWGNPEDPAYGEYILSYSPYDNVKETTYPNMLITGGLNDPRVQYWEPAKWAARLNEQNKGKSEILLKIQMESGHGGASGRYDYLKETAFDYAFLLKTTGKAESA